MGKINEVETLVWRILANDIRARNCDKYLTFRVMELYLTGDTGKVNGVILTVADLGKLPAFETVKRTRAKIQNVKGCYLPTDPAVRKRRKIQEETFREYAKSA